MQPTKPGSFNPSEGDGSAILASEPPDDSLRKLAHDLNNFLGIIIGNAELLMDQAALDARSARRAHSIYQAAIGARDAIASRQERQP